MLNPTVISRLESAPVAGRRTTKFSPVIVSSNNVRKPSNSSMDVSDIWSWHKMDANKRGMLANYMVQKMLDRNRLNELIYVAYKNTSVSPYAHDGFRSVIVPVGEAIELIRNQKAIQPELLDKALKNTRLMNIETKNFVRNGNVAGVKTSNADGFVQQDMTGGQPPKKKVSYFVPISILLISLMFLFIYLKKHKKNDKRSS